MTPRKPSDPPLRPGDEVYFDGEWRPVVRVSICAAYLDLRRSKRFCAGATGDEVTFESSYIVPVSLHAQPCVRREDA